MKDYYSKEQRRAYYLAWVQRKGPQQRNPHQLCDCGNIGTYRLGGDHICPRCKQLQTESRLHETKHEANIKWDEIGSAVARMLAVPEWMRNWRNQEAPEGGIGALLNRITVSIEEKNDELIIHAHGEYHLPLHPHT